eukprot:maker-scaffold_2-snap-gene-10.2-mRNA-1 protein AED:0.07 eAED:0.07 QI:0/0.33/0.25/1/1/1/4/224/335
MCLTFSGETSPADELCGNYGSCIENICVCNSGWDRSLDHVPHTYSGQGAEEIFNSLKKNRSKISLDEFLDELSLSAPCTKHITLWNSLHIIALFVSLQKYKFKSKTYEILKLLTIFCSICTNIMKLIEKNPMFPFSLAVSYGISCNFILLNATFHFFFVRHTKYSINKAKALCTLQPTFCGYSAGKLFLYQIKFTFFIDVVIFGTFVLLQPLTVHFNKHKNNIDFNVFYILRLLQNIQNICHIVLKSLKRDLQILTDYYSTHKDNLNKTDVSQSETVRELLDHIEWTKFFITQLFAGGLVAFLTFLVFPPSEVFMQYFGPILAGIGVPLVLIALY